MKNTKAEKSTTAKSPKKSAKPRTSAEMSPVLHEFFVDELKDIYWAEKHLTKAIPKMQKAASSPELQQAFADHLSQTQEHVRRLEQVFEMLEEKAVAKKCDAMAGIVEEGQGVIEDTEEGTPTRDVALILAGQKVEHYEIATYGGLRQLAVTMGHDEVASVLEQTLNEEKETDALLTSIAENNINYEAAEEEA
ncbi:MAG TPA: ferritin-like domain-containing protein [Panacibacter sp.]|nr:ferritin-like domain-containing protein [Panacibacter sp.]HNP46444.1 ferritin-like domain-containing protein [Panacibacter sp.]